MKIFKYTLLLFILISLSSCQDVIDVNLNTAQPKLVVDASIKWEKGTTGNEQKIKLTTTTDYYSNVIPVVSGATVFITNQDNDIFSFVETPNTGEYVCTNFIPEIDKNYVLTVIYNGETFTASEILKSVPDIISIEQREDLGFVGDEVGVKINFQDNPDQENQYLFRFETEINALAEFNVLDDRFAQGNVMFALYSNPDLKVNDIINFKLYGISKQYYNYMNILIGITGDNTGSPFSTPPATVRGNIINQTNENNFALGYFNLSETKSVEYTIL